MKKFLKISAVLGLFALVFASCSDDDGYSLDKKVLTFGMIEARNGDISNGYDIRLDNGSLLVVESNRVPNFKVEDQERIIANFTILGDLSNDSNGNRRYSVLVNYLYRVLYKDPVKLSDFDEDETLEEKIGDDPIRVDETWFGGKYLNVEFAVPVRANSSVRHFINLVYDDVELNEKGEIELYLRHNGYTEVPEAGSTNFRYGKGMVSFDISSLIPEGQTSVKVKLNWTEYVGSDWSRTVEKSDSGTFTPYGKNNTEPDNVATDYNDVNIE